MLWRWVALGVCGSWSVLALLWSAICAWLGAQGLCVQEHPPPTATSGALFPLNHLCPPLKPRSRLWGWPQTEQLSPADQQQCMLRLQTLLAKERREWFEDTLAECSTQLVGGQSQTLSV